jgi:hypothetical protein
LIIVGLDIVNPDLRAEFVIIGVGIIIPYFEKR